jgi:serine/threonine-protein kinase RsbW
LQTEQEDAMAKPESERRAAQNEANEAHSHVINNNSVEMRIPTRAEWVRVVRLATAGVAARLGFSYDDVEDLKLAVAEACNNAILHGNAGVRDVNNDESLPFVTVKWAVFPDRLHISVSDQGRLDTLVLPTSPTTSAQSESDGDELSAELPEGGMGLLLIQSLMDEVTQESGPHADTTLHMVKYAPPVETSGVRSNVPSTKAQSTLSAGDAPVSSRHPRSTSVPTKIES